MIYVITYYKMVEQSIDPNLQKESFVDLATKKETGGYTSATAPMSVDPNLEQQKFTEIAKQTTSSTPKTSTSTSTSRRRRSTSTQTTQTKQIQIEQPTQEQIKVEAPKIDVSTEVKTVVPENIQEQQNIRAYQFRQQQPNTYTVMSAEPNLNLLQKGRYSLDVASSKFSQDIQTGSIGEKLIAIPGSFAVGLGSAGLQVIELGVNIFTNTDEVLNQFGSAIASPVKTAGAIAQGFVKNPYQFAGEVVGDVLITKGAGKLKQGIKTAVKGKEYAVTYATDPIIVQSGTEQRLLVNQFEDIVTTKQKPPKVSSTLDVEYKGFETVGVDDVGELSLYTKGKGKVDLQDQTFKITEIEQTDPFNIQDLQPSKNKYFSKAEDVSKDITIAKGKDFEITKPYDYTKVTIKKSELIETPLADAPYSSVGIKKGKFVKPKSSSMIPESIEFAYQLDNELAIFGKDPTKEYLLSKTVDSKAMSKLDNIFTDQTTKKTYTSAKGSTVTEQITKPTVTEKPYTPIVNIQEVKPKTTKGFFYLSDASYDQDIGVGQTTQNNILTTQTIDVGLGSKQIITEPPKYKIPDQKPQEILINPIIDEGGTKPKPPRVKVTHKPKQGGTYPIVSSPILTPKEKTTPTFDQVMTPKVKIPTKGGQQYKTFIPTKLFTQFTDTSKNKFMQKQKGSYQPIYDVFIKRAGKYKKVGGGLSLSEASFIGGDIVDRSVARTLKLMPSGYGIKKGGQTLALDLGRYKQKNGFTFIEKSKYAISTFGEKEELKKAKKRKGDLNWVF